MQSYGHNFYMYLVHSPTIFQNMGSEKKYRLRTTIYPRFMKLQNYIYLAIWFLIHDKVKISIESNILSSQITKY